MVWPFIVALLAFVAAVVFRRYRREIGAERRRVSTGSQVIETACGRVEFGEMGAGPPVLVIHGAGGGFDQGLEFAAPLAARGFRVIAVSRFGYLRTPLPEDASPGAQADAHACLLDALRIGRAHVIGASAGAPSAMQFGLRHPDKCASLVLLFPLAYAPRPEGAAVPTPSAFVFPLMAALLRWDFLYWAATRLLRQTLIRTILATPIADFRAAPPEEQARALEIMRHILPVSRRAKGIWNDARIGGSLRRYDLERLAAPTLLISAQDDLYGTFASARYTAEHLPDARFLGFATGGHLLLGHWQEAFEAVLAFLKNAD